MFDKDDYQNYFEEAETKFKKLLVDFTDILNELDNKAVKSKILSQMKESLGNYRAIRDINEKYFKKKD